MGAAAFAAETIVVVMMVVAVMPSGRGGGGGGRHVPLCAYAGVHLQVRGCRVRWWVGVQW